MFKIDKMNPALGIETVKSRVSNLNELYKCSSILQLTQVTFESMPKNADFDSTFAELKGILEPYESKLNVVTDTADNYSLETPHIMKNKHRLHFGGVKRGKAYVSFHLIPVYACADLAKEISPELKKRMQGKSCFNFTSPDQKLFNELRRLTKAGFARFTSKKFYSKF